MNIALVLAGGTGVRLGSEVPKQYIEVNGKPVISYCIEQLSGHDRIDAIQIVAALKWRNKIKDWILKEDKKGKFRGFSECGVNRQLSIYHGLEDIRGYAKDSDNVLVHDAARPLLSTWMISKCLGAIEEHEGVLPVLPLKDTVYGSIDGRRVTALLNRNEIFAGQTPEVFKLGIYYEANKRLMPDRILQINGSAEAAVLAGMDIVMLPGDEMNFKITTGTDLEKFTRIMELRETRMK